MLGVCCITVPARIWHPLYSGYIRLKSSYEVGLIVGSFSFGLLFIILPLIAIAGIVAIFVAVRTTFAVRRFAVAGLRSGGIAFVALRAFSL